MDRELTHVEKARKMSGMTQSDAAGVIGMTNVTYGRKEKSPENFTLGEFFALFRVMAPDEQEVMWTQLIALSQVRGKDGAARAVPVACSD